MYVVNKTQFLKKLLDWLLIALRKWEYAEFSRNILLDWWLKWSIKLTINLLMFFFLCLCARVNIYVCDYHCVWPCITSFARTYVRTYSYISSWQYNIYNAQKTAFIQLIFPSHSICQHFNAIDACPFKCEISFVHMIIIINIYWIV